MGQDGTEPPAEEATPIITLRMGPAAEGQREGGSQAAGATPLGGDASGLGRVG